MELKNNILIGDSLKILKSLPNKTFNMCVTSPPYWALRDYGIKVERTFLKCFANALANIGGTLFPIC